MEETRKAAAADRCPSHVHTFKAAALARRTCEKDLRGLGKQPGRYGRDR